LIPLQDKGGAKPDDITVDVANGSQTPDEKGDKIE